MSEDSARQRRSLCVCVCVCVCVWWARLSLAQVELWVNTPHLMEPVQETERVQTLGEHKHNVTQREQPMEGLRADLRSGTALRSKRKQSSCRRREVCVRVCVRACLRVCMRACVRVFWWCASHQSVSQTYCLASGTGSCRRLICQLGVKIWCECLAAWWQHVVKWPSCVRTCLCGIGCSAVWPVWVSYHIC